MPSIAELLGKEVQEEEKTPGHLTEEGERWKLYIARRPHVENDMWDCWPLAVETPRGVEPPVSRTYRHESDGDEHTSWVVTYDADGRPLATFVIRESPIFGHSFLAWMHPSAEILEIEDLDRHLYRRLTRALDKRRKERRTSWQYPLGEKYPYRFGRYKEELGLE